MSSLINLLKEYFPDSSKNTIRAWLSQKRILIDGVPLDFCDQINEKQKITLRKKREHIGKGAYVVFESSDFVIIEKPINMLSVATLKQQSGTLHDLLKRRFHKPHIVPVHRLDMETSGLIIFAYTKKALDHLKQQLSLRLLQRKYKACVVGVPMPLQGTWNFPLKEQINLNVHVDWERGIEAITHYSVFKRYKKYSLLNVSLETGRKHQIRVHCAEAGYPIVGDTRYGGEPASRLMLHATHLSLNDPCSGERLHFESDYFELEVINLLQPKKASPLQQTHP